MAYIPGMSKAKRKRRLSRAAPKLNRARDGFTRRKLAEHRKHIKENRGGRDDRPAGTPGATKLRRTKYPLGKPLYTHMTEGRIAANAERPTEALVKLMQCHSPAALAGITSHNSMTRPGTIQGALMGPDEYASDIDGRERPWQYTVADYEVRAGRDGRFGIYTRKYDVRLATFAPNSAALRNALARMFNAANALKQSEITKFKRSKLPVGKQIALRQADERKINKGWYTCQCGQWVNDKTCPCSVCRRTWGVADARVKLPKGHRFRYLADGAD